jgi:hypothetical protein
MKRIAKTLCLMLLAASTLVSCDPGPAGIFSLLEDEEPLNEGTDILNDNTTAFVLAFNGYYYAAVGSNLLRRPGRRLLGGRDRDRGAVPGKARTTSYRRAWRPLPSLRLLLARRVDHPSDGQSDAWESYATASSPRSLPDEPVQSLLYANSTLFVATSPDSTGSSSSTYTSYYSIYYDNGGAFASAGVADVACGLPSSIAHDGANYWIPAGNTIFTGTAANGLAADTTNVAATTIDSEYPVFSVCYDASVGVLASACGKLYQLATGGYTASGTFGSAARRLSSVAVVPSNEGGNAVIVGVKPWASDGYLGYYEYDADTTFNSSLGPDTDYNLVTTNSNYVTTLDDMG